MNETSLYVHIPYCRQKCIYCDFFSGGDSHADWARLASALCRELEERKHELPSPPSSLYIGGGTPSLIPEEVFVKLSGSLMDVAGCERVVEFTVEVNPDDVSTEKAAAWKQAGVNRISMGVQSFVDAELKSVGRRHTAEEAKEAFRLLRSYFGNVSIDLMFGLPGQTLESWNFTVEEAMRLAPDHVSAYSLMLEECTPLSVLHRQGRLEIPDEAEVATMWESLSARLRMEGFRQYEISNYSRVGFESVHNSRYWRQNPYLGLGPSAHSYDGQRTRRWNPSDIKGYLGRFAPETSGREAVLAATPYYIEEMLDEEELRDEFILTRLRTADGLPLSEYSRRFGTVALERLKRNSRKEIDRGLLEACDGSLRLTPQGIMVSDDVMLTLAM